MTISTTTAKSRYAGDGSTTSFPTGFKFLANEHVRVILQRADGGETVWTEGSEYSLAGAGAPGGGTVEVSTDPVDRTPAAGETLVVKLAVPARQETSLPLGGAFPSTAVEAMADLAALRDQQIGEALSRTPKFKETSVLADVAFPEPEAGKPVGWNAAGDALVNLQAIGRWQGDWQTATDYVALDMVRDPTTKNIYVCDVAHTSGTFATDLAGGRWAEAIDVEAVETAKVAAETAQATAEAAQAAAETAEANAETARAAAASSASTAAASETNAGNIATAAAASASTASTAAIAAQTAETNAETAEAAAKAAQAAAETAETNAETAEANAEAAASNAGNSATAAAASAAAVEALYEDLEAVQTAVTAAQTAETNAETAQAAAETAQAAAETAQAAAETAETNAETAATNAANSASTASTAATNAGNSATAAAASASTASTAAIAAQMAETNAETAEAAAETAQTAAETAETNAETAATAAASSASAAATSATNADNSATAAATSATDAGNSATAAAASATNAETAQAAAEAAQVATEAAAADGIAIVPHGAWQSGTSYSEDDGVTYEGSFWRSLQDSNQGNSPSSSPAFWEETVEKGDTGAAGPAADTVIMLAVSDETTAIEAGTAKLTFRMPHAFTLSAVRASLVTASSSGAVIVDINENGSTILSTKLTIDQDEKTSTTAAMPAMVSDTALADDAEITVDIDGAGTGATGLKVTLIGTPA
jgi:hypothetical protein